MQDKFYLLFRYTLGVLVLVLVLIASSTTHNTRRLAPTAITMHNPVLSLPLPDLAGRW
jgi:hypothetical protein